MGQRLSTKDERPPSVSSRRTHRSLPTASRLSYIPRPATRKGGRLLFDLSEYHWCIHVDMDCTRKLVSMPPQVYLFRVMSFSIGTKASMPAGLGMGLLYTSFCYLCSFFFLQIFEECYGPDPGLE